MNILALDIGMNGAYVRNYGPSPRSGLVDCTRDAKARAGVSMFRLKQFLESQPEPELIVHEVLIGRGAQARLLMGFGAVVEMYATTRLIPIRTVPPTTLKKWATGSGKADKDAMAARAHVTNHNLGDALLLEYQLRRKVNKKRP